MPNDGHESSSCFNSSSDGGGFPSISLNRSRELSSGVNPYFSASLKNTAVPVLNRSSSCLKYVRASGVASFFDRMKVEAIRRVAITGGIQEIGGSRAPVIRAFHRRQLEE